VCVPYKISSLWQWRTVGGVGVQPPPKFRRPSKIVPNSTRLWKLLKIAEFGTPTPQNVRKKGSKVLKLPSVRNCFTLAMTNKLVVIINILKVPKMKKILLYEMKFLVPNYSCLQNPWLGGYRPHIPVLSVLSWICWNPPGPNKIPGYATALWYVLGVQQTRQVSLKFTCNTVHYNPASWERDSGGCGHHHIRKDSLD